MAGHYSSLQNIYSLLPVYIFIYLKLSMIIAQHEEKRRDTSLSQRKKKSLEGHNHTHSMFDTATR
jgi:hypothetical protein